MPHGATFPRSVLQFPSRAGFTSPRDIRGKSIAAPRKERKKERGARVLPDLSARRSISRAGATVSLSALRIASANSAEERWSSVANALRNDAGYQEPGLRQPSDKRNARIIQRCGAFRAPRNVAGFLSQVPRERIPKRDAAQGNGKFLCSACFADGCSSATDAEAARRGKR